MQIFFPDDDHDDLINGKRHRMCGSAVLSMFMKKPGHMSSPSPNDRSNRHVNPLTSSSSGSTNTCNIAGSNNRRVYPTQQLKSHAEGPLPSKASEGTSDRSPSLSKKDVATISGKYGTTTRSCMPVHGSRTLTGISSSPSISSNNQGGYQQLAKDDSKLREGAFPTTEDVIQEERGRDVDEMFQHHVPLQSVIQFDPHVISDLKSKHIQAMNERKWRSETGQYDAGTLGNKSDEFSPTLLNKRVMVSMPPLSEGPTDSELSGIQNSFPKIVRTNGEEDADDEEGGRADITQDGQSPLWDTWKEPPSNTKELAKLQLERQNYQSEAVALRKEIERFRKELDNIRKVLPRKTNHWSDEAWDKIDSNIELDDSHFVPIPTRETLPQKSKIKETLPQKSKINASLRHFKVDWKLDLPNQDGRKGEATPQKGDADIDMEMAEGTKLNSSLSGTIRKVILLDDAQHYEDPDIINPLGQSESSDESEEDSMALRTYDREQEPSERTQVRGRQPERVERVFTKRDSLYGGVKIAGPDEPNYCDEGILNNSDEEQYIEDGVVSKVDKSLKRTDHECSAPKKLEGNSHVEPLRGTKKGEANMEGTGQHKEGRGSSRATWKSISNQSQGLPSASEGKVDNSCKMYGGHVKESKGRFMGPNVLHSREHQHPQDVVQVDVGLDQDHSKSGEMQNIQSFDGNTVSETNAVSCYEQESDFHEGSSREESSPRKDMQPIGEVATKDTLNSPGKREVNKKLPDAFAFWQDRLHLSSAYKGAEGKQTPGGFTPTNEPKRQNWEHLDRFHGNQARQVGEVDGGESVDAMARDDLMMVREGDDEDRIDNEVTVATELEEYRRDMQLVQKLLRKYEEIPNPRHSSESKSTFSRGSRANPSFSAEAPSDESTKEPTPLFEIENIDAVIEYRSPSVRDSRDPDKKFQRHAELPERVNSTRSRLSVSERERSIPSRKSVVLQDRRSLTLGISPRVESETILIRERGAISDASTIKKIYLGDESGARDTFKDYLTVTKSLARESKTQPTNSSIQSREPSTVSSRKVGKLCSQALQFWESSKANNDNIKSIQHPANDEGFIARPVS